MKLQIGNVVRKEDVRQKEKTLIAVLDVLVMKIV